MTSLANQKSPDTREANGVIASAPLEQKEATRAPAVLQARALAYAFTGGPPVLEGIDLDIGVGEIVAFVGPRGAGKSTLLRLLSGELEPTSGTLERPASRSSAGRMMVGYAPVEGAHYETLSGRENALFLARAAGLRRVDAVGAVAEHMSLLGLAAEGSRPVSGYDFAARRKLLLVEALSHRPALTVLDEPFRGLDMSAREALIHILRLQSAKRGTVVVASAELPLLPELADRIVFMHQGRIVRGGRVAELLSALGPEVRIEIELDRRPQQLDVRFRTGITLLSDGDPIVVESTRGQAVVGEVCSALIAAGAVIGGVKIREPDLAEVFRRATGVELGA
jgi:ABC-2 type transport system ATP-binding protein